jgi:beta-RFAP synthase
MGGVSGVPVRHFGGVGLMVRDPGVRVTVQAAPEWSAEGPLAERALVCARQFTEHLPPCFAPIPQHIVVESCPPEHVGLGTGTQLALAIGRALLAAFGDLEMDASDLGRRLGRGARSALGIHGFEHGGFLIEAGKGDADEAAVAPLVARCCFPEDWRIVLAIPAWAKGVHGVRERQAFQELQNSSTPPGTTDALCRLALLGMLPALAEHDLATFSEALYDFNRRVGELFAPVQGGPYAHPRSAELVGFIRQQGVRGVGQSSWGATIFAIVGDDGEAGILAGQIRDHFRLDPGEVICTAACNTGATLC